MKTHRSMKKAALLISTMLSALTFAAAQPPAEPVDEIVVVGRNIPDPQRNTSEVVSVLTADDLARTGDDNAALALTRLSGLSLVGGRFVYVRGLGDRYSSALLNGAPLPSPEPLRRQVPLDLFPSNILAGATVQRPSRRIIQENSAAASSISEPSIPRRRGSRISSSEAPSIQRLP